MLLHVSLFVELLRSQPRVLVWTAALAQAVLWWQIYGTARWAVGCRAMAERHL